MLARVGWSAVLASALVLAGCQASDEQPPASSHPAATTSGATTSDQEQLRELYTDYMAALSAHDGEAQAQLTCASERDRVLREAQEDPMLNIGFFGSPDEVRRLGVDVATANMLGKLAPASAETVRSVVEAISAGNVDAYTTAVKQLRREVTKAELLPFDKVEVTGDTATVEGSYTVQFFTKPKRVLQASNTAVREDGRWKDCTPQRHTS